eukprot:gene34045-43991_t
MASNEEGLKKNLAHAEENRLYMGSIDLGLLQVLVSVVSTDSGLALSSDSGEARLQALGTIKNLSIASENKVVMGSKGLGLIPALVVVVSSDSGVAREKSLGTLWNLSLYRQNVEYLVFSNGMSVILAALQSSQRESDSFRYSFSVFMTSLRDITAARAVVAAGGVDIFSSLLESGGGVNELKAAIVLSFLLGKDESGGVRLSLLESKPQLGDILESIFINTTNGMDGDDYLFGNFDLIVIVAAIASMAVSDKNKAIILQKPTIVRCLFQVLSLFIDDAPPIAYRGTAPSRGGVGGGGQDIESAESAIEALQLLSFAFESDSDLRQQYNVIEMDTVSLLQRLSTHPKLSDDARRGAQHLSRRLHEMADQPPTAEEDISTPSVAVDNKKHLMLSYAWGCRKELVIS